ncbi:MAG TPA: carboxypeptidase-like regulatory domain-containing protein, partial [Longimicrobiaceae bacterium]|nr:carboxypeptidase-like regulatory domain-containing protein [Longimicrobiaceae bacterium]
MRGNKWLEGALGKMPSAASRLARRAATSVSLIAAVAVTLFSMPSTTVAQQGTVSGTVVSDGSLRPLAGAQVVAEGTGLGTIADANGRFMITGLSGSEVTLQVQMIGYQTATETVPIGTNDVRIELSQSAIALDEVVVTGTAGGQQRRAIGNSIATVAVEEIAETAPVKTMQDLINGRAPGVVIMPGTGQIGSGSRIRIRGTSTFSLSSDPLIYVDGVRVNNETGSGISAQAFGSGVVSRLNDFDPSQIASIEILKGPAAATLYGTEAARGVINIITKKGTPGGHRFSLTVTQGINTFDDAIDRMPVNYWRDPDGEVHALNVTELRNEMGQPLFETGRIQQYSLNVSGGNEDVRYFVAADVNDDKGVEVTNFRDSYSGRANISVSPAENFDIGVNTGYVHSTTGLSCEGG